LLSNKCAQRAAASSQKSDHPNEQVQLRAFSSMTMAMIMIVTGMGRFSVSVKLILVFLRKFKNATN